MKNLLFASLILIFGCSQLSDDPTDLEIDFGFAVNRPVISNTGNVYSFVVNADDFALRDEGKVEMDSALVLSVVVDGYDGGSLRFSVFDHDSSVVLDRELTSNIVISEFPAFSARSVITHFENFTGRVTIALRKNEQ